MPKRMFPINIIRRKERFLGWLIGYEQSVHESLDGNHKWRWTAIYITQKDLIIHLSSIFRYSSIQSADRAARKTIVKFHKGEL